MRFWMCLMGRALLVLTSLALSGCLPSPQSQLEEEKEPHFLAGKGRVNAMDYKGAIEAFDKALKVNPESASAHFELGWLCDQKDANPAAAIYHYECYLQLRPKADNAEFVKQHILACEQELARKVSLGPVSEKVTRELEQLTEENKRLTEQNKQLSDELVKWRAYYAGRTVLTNQTGTPVLPRTSGLQTPAPAPAVSNATLLARSPGPTRSHTIKSGETPSVIARQYGIRLDALMAANPGLDARRLRPGQALSIPSP